MIIVFTGPPLSGKGTQGKLLGEYLHLPVLSIGALLREACEKGDAKALEGYNNYAMHGKWVPINLKFHLLKDKLDSIHSGFILESFPSTQEDLDTFLDYVSERNLKIDAVFNMHVSEEIMRKRMLERKRIDDTEEIVGKRRVLQEQDRKPVVDYFRKEGILKDIEGDGTVEEVHQQILESLNV